MIDTHITETTKQIYLSNLNTQLINNAVEYEVVNNELIINIDNSGPWEQRFIAYTNMLLTLLNKYEIPNCKLRISLDDYPKKGYFHFCRKINEDGYLLIPNFRFFNDNVVNTPYYEYKNKYSLWKDTTKYIYNNDTIPFNSKLSKYFFMGGGRNRNNDRNMFFNKINENTLLFDGYEWKSTNYDLIKKVEMILNILKNILNINFLCI